LQISDIALRRELWQTLRSNSVASEGVGQKVIRRSSGAKPTIAEQRLLELLLADSNLRREILPRLQTADYADLSTSSIFRALIEIESAGIEPDLDALTEKVEGDELATQLLPMLLMGEIESPELEKADDSRIAAEKCLDALRLVNIDRRIRELSSEIATAERLGDDARVVELISEYGGLDRLRKSFEPQSQIAQADNR
jgi:hypothetical protein